MKEDYDSLKIKSLTMQGIETDPAKIKNDANKLEQLRRVEQENVIIDYSLVCYITLYKLI